MSLLEELKLAGNLVAHWDFRRRSLLDLSGGGNHMSTVSGTPTWISTPKGPAVQFAKAGTNYLTCGNPASLQLATPTTLFAVARMDQFPPGSGNYQAIFGKNRWGWMALRTAAQNRFGFYTSMADVSCTYLTVMGEIALFAFNYTSGAAGSYFVNGVARGNSVVLSILDQTRGWTIGGDGDLNEGLQGCVLQAGLVDRLLTPAEHARLYNEWAAEGWVGDSPKVIRYSYPSMGAAEYAARGIVLDTDFQRQSATVVRDMVGSYPGTIAGTPVPCPQRLWPDAGMSFVAGKRVNLPNVTQLNNASKFTHTAWVTEADAPVAGDAAWYENTDATHLLILVRNVSGGASSQVRAFVNNGLANSYGTSDAIQLRARCTHCVQTTFDGTKATDAEKLCIDMDGERIPLTFAAAIPTTVANLAAATPRIAYDWAGDIHNTRLRCAVALTPDERRAEYLEGARHIDWQAQGEGTPPSLVASVAAGGYVGEWRVISGTFKISEDSTGKRWLGCVGNGVVAIPQTKAFGTHTFTVYQGAAGNILDVMFHASLPVARTDAAQTGYFFWIDNTQRLRVARKDPGAGYANLLYSAVAYAPAAQAYTFALNRRPSDGRFTLWVKGGTFAAWTLVIPQAGVGGSNPTGGDTSYTTSTWMVFGVYSGDKLLLHDPAKPGAGPTHYLGQLLPTLGELPDTLLLNILRWSERLTVAPWVVFQATATSVTAVGPSGGSEIVTQVLSYPAAPPSFVYQFLAAGQANPGAQYTLSVYVKFVSGGSQTMGLVFYDTPTGTHAEMTCDLATGQVTVTAGAWSNIYAGVEDVGGGWFRVWLSAQTNAALTALENYISISQPLCTFLLTKAQLVQGPCAGSYRETQ